MTTNIPTRFSPSWLHESGPRWCVRTHAEDDHEEDRFHQSEPALVPLVASRADSARYTEGFESFDITIRVGRYAGDTATWVAVERLDLEGRRLVLTTESARALAQAVDDQLRRCKL